MQVNVIKKINGRVNRDTGTLLYENLKVAAYCRVSTDSEDQLNSYQAQKAYYNEKIRENSKWDFVGIYADEGISGTQDHKRTDFLRMISDATDKKIDLILTKSISRFARNTLDTLKYVRLLKEKNVGIIFEEENINTLEMSGELLLTILSSVAQQESENISEHVKLGLKMRKEKGELVGFNNCLGYEYDRETKTMLIKEDEAEIVRYIFDRYCSGIGCKTIARELTAQKHKTPKGLDVWAESTVMGIIKNEKYKGDVLMGKTFTTDPITKKRVTNRGEEDKYYISEHHKGIISAETYEKAHEILRKRSDVRETGRRKGNYSKKYPLSSKLYCGFCGTVLTRRNMNSGSKTSKRIWQCMRAVKMGKEYCEESRIIREDIIEQAFVDSYRLLSNNNKSIINKFLNRVEGVISQSSFQNEKNRIEKQIDLQRSKIDKLLELLTENIIDKIVFAERKIAIDKKIEKLENDLMHIKLEEEDKQNINNGIDKLKKIFESDIVFDTFDKDIFEATVKFAIIGEIDDNNNENPYIIRFILRNGSNYNRVIDNVLNLDTVTILEFDSKQSFFIFEKNDRNFHTKKLIESIKVRVELES